MTLLIAIPLLTILTLALCRYGRSLLFPPAALSAVWALTLFFLWLFQDVYFPVTTKAIEIVFVGVLAYSLGGISAVAAPVERSRPLSMVTARRRKQLDRWLNVALVLFLLNIPLSYSYFKLLSQNIAPRESSWRQIRIASSKANISGQNSLPLETLILPFMSIIALIAVYEYADTGSRRGRTLLLVVLAAGYQLLNGARSEVLLLLISAVVILWLKRGAAPLSVLAGLCVFFLLVFSAGQISMNKYGADSQATLTDNLPRVAEGIGTYWLGGIIAFDQNRQNPELTYGWDLGKFYKRIANRFGGHYPERDRNLQYTRISPTQITNVYTVFLPYYMDHGQMYGVMALMFLAGFTTTYVYRCAIHDSCWAVFTLGALMYATVMTVFSEEFFAQITFCLKCAAFPTLIYFAPSILPRVHRRPTNATREPEQSVCA